MIFSNIFSYWSNTSFKNLVKKRIQDSVLNTLFCVSDFSSFFLLLTLLFFATFPFRDFLSMCFKVFTKCLPLPKKPSKFINMALPLKWIPCLAIIFSALWSEFMVTVALPDGFPSFKSKERDDSVSRHRNWAISSPIAKSYGRLFRKRVIGAVLFYRALSSTGTSGCNSDWAGWHSNSSPLSVLEKEFSRSTHLDLHVLGHS